jgi:predicted enzyme related to lactoylglutathione lyase
VIGIGGVFFKSKNPKKLAVWYRRYLGIPVKGEYATFGWKAMVNPRRSGHTIWALFPRDTDYFGSSPSDLMVNYRVKNLRRLLNQLKKEGVKVEEKVEEYPYGKFGWVYDLEGNKIELWEPPSGYLPPGPVLKSE